MNAVFDRVLFGGQAEGVVAHRVQHIETFQPLITAIDIRSDITQGMTHVQPGPARVRKHIEHIAFGPGAFMRYPVYARCFPALLPFVFNIPELVFHLLLW